MNIDGYTTVGFRTRSTNSTKHSNDVGVFLPNKVHNRATHNIDESEIYNPDRYKHQINRSAETDATRFKGIGNKYQNLSKFYN